MARNKNTGYGAAFLQGIENVIPNLGNVLVVKSSSDTADSNYQKLQDIFTPDNNGQVRFFTSISDAITAASTNNNDVIVLDSHSSYSLDAGIALTKSRIHFIGFDSGDHLVDMGAKIVLATAATTAYVLKNTGIRNSFRNIKFINSSTQGTALNVVADSGEGTIYKNCGFEFGVANNIGSTSATEFLAACDSCSFINCKFGNDILLTTAARQVLLAKTDTTEMKSNIFVDCNFIISSSSATATFIRLNAVTDVLFTNLWKNCCFMASVDTAGGIALTGGAVITGTGTTKGTLNFYYPGFFNCGGSLAAGGANAGVQVVAPASVTTAIKGIQPTA